MVTLLKRATILLQEWKIIKNLTLRNVKIKYKGTWLGFFWVILQPLCTIFILYFVFSHVVRLNIDNFPLFLCTGVLPWTFFASSLVEATGSVVTNSNLVLKVNFPLEILPLSYCLSNLFDFIFSLCILVPILYFLGIKIPILYLLFLIPIIIFHLFFVTGLSLLFSVAHVFYKDVGHLLSVVLMFWFYLTPIFYSIDHLPAHITLLYSFNPMMHFINGYRDVLFSVSLPPLLLYVKLIGIGFVFLLIGWIVFMVKEKSMVKEL